VIPTPTTTILPNAPKHRRVVPPQKFDIVLVMDFEATCDENTQNYPHEIIEFPCVAIDAHCRCTSYSTQMAPPPGTGGGGGGNKAIIGEFQSYVKPRRNPKLTPFCTELTGITQDQVDAAPSLPQVVASFEKWLYEELIPKYEKERLPLYPHLQAAAAVRNVNNNNNKNGRRRNNNNNDDDDNEEKGTTENSSSSSNIRCVIACDGPWDIRKFLFELSVVRDGIYFPPIFYSFLNVRQEFATYFKCKPLGLGQTLGRLGFSFEGNPHSGIDDARNISRVVKVLLDRGHRFGNACRIGTTSKEGQLLHQSLRRVRDSSGGVVRPPRGSQDELLLFGFSRGVDDSESDDADGNDSEDQDGKKKTAKKKKKKHQQQQQPSKAAIAQKQQQQQQQQQATSILLFLLFSDCSGDADADADADTGNPVELEWEGEMAGDNFLFVVVVLFVDSFAGRLPNRFRCCVVFTRCCCCCRRLAVAAISS